MAHDRVTGVRHDALTVSLRPAAPEDEPFLLQVYGSTRIDELALVDWAPGQQEAFLQMQLDAQHKHYALVFPGMHYWVVVRDGSAIGRMMLAKLADEWRLVDIALLPEHRGTGLGTTLMQDLMADATCAGKRVTLHVESFNPARHLYERLGYVKVSEQSIYWLMEWRPPSDAEGRAHE